MRQLSYETLLSQGYSGYLSQGGPERVLQFGEGNFLRAFADYFIDVANEKAGFGAKVTVVQPIPDGIADLLEDQEGLYTLYLRGIERGEKVEEKRVISCVSRAINPYKDFEAYLSCARNPELRYIISNTTEAGIVFDDRCGENDAPPSSYPAKLTQLLLERFNTFGAEAGKGLVILPCELIDDNGKELKRCVERYIHLWKLPEDFSRWVEKEILFCSTLVDRIVTGYPRKDADALNAQNDYKDSLLNTGEIFGLWVIEGPESLERELPFAKAGLPVLTVRDHKPYKQRKVRILNGAHTTMVPAAYLAGKEIVRDCMEDDVIRGFLEAVIQEEIIPTLTLPKEELESFAASVCERFGNPYIDHPLISIALNTTSKWRTRVMPSLKGYVERFGKLPTRMVFGFAATLSMFRGDSLTRDGLRAKRGNESYAVSDDRESLEFYYAHRNDNRREFVQAVAGNAALWGEDLSKIQGFVDLTAAYMDRAESVGMYEAIRELV